MAGFCDECGESFSTATSKFCGNCGKKRVIGNVEVAHAEPIVVRENTTEGEEARDSLWVVLEYSGNLTLYDRVYGIKPRRWKGCCVEEKFSKKCSRIQQAT